MIDYVNSFLLLTLLGMIYYIYCKYRRLFRVFNIVMDSAILNHLSNLEKEVDSELTKPKRGRKKKTIPSLNEEEENNVRDMRERPVECVLSGNSKQYLGKEYTEQQINEMDGNNINTLSNRYESVLSAQMTKSLGKSIINLYPNIASKDLKESIYHGAVTSILVFGYTMLAKTLIKMSPPSLGKFDVVDGVKLVEIIALSDFTKDYLIKQKLIPDDIWQALDF